MHTDAMRAWGAGFVGAKDYFLLSQNGSSNAGVTLNSPLNSHSDQCLGDLSKGIVLALRKGKFREFAFSTRDPEGVMKIIRERAV